MRSLLRHPAVLGALLVLLVFVVYGRVAGHEFLNFDDDRYVTDNPMVNEGFTSAGVRRAFTESVAANWHPVTWLSHMLDVELFGVASGPHHLVNVVLHALNVLLLFLLLRRMTGGDDATGAAAMVAAIFAVHPVHVESVAWLAERKDVLSMLFGLLTLHAWVWWTRAPSFGRYVAVAVPFALGLMAKPMLVTLPCVLLLLDVWPLARTERGWRTLVVEKLPMFALVGLSGVATVWAQKAGGAVQGLGSLTLGERLANAMTSYVAYLGKALWPFELPFFYPYDRDGGGGSVALAIVLLLALTAVAVWQRSRRPWLLVGWLWYVGTLVPMIGIVQVGSQSMANRYVYLPLIGVYVAVVWTIRERLSSRASVPLAVAVVGGLAAVCAWQIGFWKDGRTLYTRALAITDGNFVAHHNLGILDKQRGEPADAERNFRAAVRANPAIAETRLRLGEVLSELGRPAEARAEYEHARRIAPAVDESASFHLNLGLAWDADGRPDLAIPSFRRAVELDDTDADAWNKLGRALAQSNDFDEARRCFERAIERDPDYAPAHNNLGSVHWRQGRLDAAIASFARALEIDPSYELARTNLEAARQAE